MKSSSDETLPLFSFRVGQKIANEGLSALGEIAPPSHERHEQAAHNRQDQPVID